MGTRGIIARHTGEGTFSGVYHHWDSYPTCLGRTLFHLFTGHFQMDMQAMLKALLEDHPAGYSTINGTDFSLPAGYLDGVPYETNAAGEKDYSKPIPHGPRCFCHGSRHEEPSLCTHISDVNAEWAYALTDAGEMHVYIPNNRYIARKGERQCIIGWQRVATVDLWAAEPDWNQIECGKTLERCHHIAAHHFPELDGTPLERLSVDSFLGREPMDPVHEAYAFVYNGKTYTAKRGGCSGTDSRGRNLWLSSVDDEDFHNPRVRTYWGQSSKGYMPTFILSKAKRGGAAKPFPGVTPLLPPNLADDPISVFAMIRAAKAATEEKPGATANTPAEPGSGLLALAAALPRKFRD